MRKIKKLRGVSAEEAKHLLSDAAIATVEQFWERISEEKDGGTAEVARQTGITQQRLRELLAAESLRPSGRLGSGWIKKHWFDLALLSLLLALAILVWRAWPALRAALTA